MIKFPIPYILLANRSTAQESWERERCDTYAYLIIERKLTDGGGAD